MTQSPIDISETSGASVEPIEFDYHLTPLEIVHNGHTVQVNYQPGSGITVGGKRYELLQFHFHTPSVCTAWPAANSPWRSTSCTRARTASLPWSAP